MKKITKGLCLLLTIVMCLTVTQPVYAKTKYTKAEKKLAFALACYQDDLLYPESFNIKKISKVKYTVIKDYYESLDAWGILDDCKTITWKVDFTAYNVFGAPVKDTLYVSSTWVPFDNDDVDIEEDYIDKTNYAKSSMSKSFVKKVKKLTSKYYNEF